MRTDFKPFLNYELLQSWDWWKCLLFLPRAGSRPGPCPVFPGPWGVHAVGAQQGLSSCLSALLSCLWPHSRVLGVLCRPLLPYTRRLAELPVTVPSQRGVGGSCYRQQRVSIMGGAGGTSQDRSCCSLRREESCPSCPLHVIWPLGSHFLISKCTVWTG